MSIENERRILSYTTAQAAEATGRSVTRIKKAIRDKELTAVKDGRATLITRAELERWLGTMRTIGREVGHEGETYHAEKRPAE